MIKMIRKGLLMLLFLSIGSSQLVAQNYQFQSLFIYNIIKRINWPQISNDFIIGVIGSKDLVVELKSLSEHKKLGDKRIKVIAVNPNKDSFEDVHVLYLGRSSSSKVDLVNAKIAQVPVLLIGDKPGIKGVSINFIDNSKKIEFEIYPNTIESHSLTIASSLLSLGTVKE